MIKVSTEQSIVSLLQKIKKVVLYKEKHSLTGISPTKMVIGIKSKY